MVLGLGKNKKKKEEEEAQFKRDVVISEQQRPQQTPMTEDYIASLGRSVYMVMDPEVTNILSENAQLKSLIPAFSHLNRVSRIGKGEAELLEFDYEYMFLLHTLTMNEDEYETKEAERIEALKLHSRFIIHDSFGGWKGNLVTEQIKTIRTELEKTKKKRLPF